MLRARYIRLCRVPCPPPVSPDKCVLHAWREWSARLTFARFIALSIAGDGVVRVSLSCRRHCVTMLAFYSLLFARARCIYAGTLRLREHVAFTRAHCICACTRRREGGAPLRTKWRFGSATISWTRKDGEATRCSLRNGRMITRDARIYVLALA